MTGTVKLHPFIIGQRKSPHSFRRQSLRVEDYCVYNYNSTAWMTTESFQVFLKFFDRDMVARGHTKVLLVIDNCTSHQLLATTSLQRTEVAFLPPNTTSMV